MEKPKPKKEVAIKFSKREANLISFFASKDAVEDFKEFGFMTHFDDGSYWLTVDPRYDFEEVLSYIENYDVTNESP